MPCRTGTFAYLHTQNPAFHAKSRLDTLTAFLRAAVLPHATNEEDRLYPDGVAAPFRQLRAEHAHINALTEQLEHVDAASCTLPELRQMVDGLEHHMITEHTALGALLAALDDMPCVPDPEPGAPVSAPDHVGRTQLCEQV
jgi:hypothetical protein